MTEKQKMFAEEYLIDLNKTQAAIRAGYSPRTAGEQGSRLYKNVQVRAYIDREMAKRSKRVGVNADRVVRELARIGFANVRDVLDFDEATVLPDADEDDTAAVASVRVKTTSGSSGTTTEREVKLHDKTKSLELLGKHCGMWPDKMELVGDSEIKVTIKVEE